VATHPASLNVRRQHLKLSVAELSRKSGVRYPRLYHGLLGGAELMREELDAVEQALNEVEGALPRNYVIVTV
jgi:hypothetical protein